MANQNKFEQMLEKLIAEDRAGAEELFHEIVVEKSRTIYEKLLDDDMPEVEVDEAAEKDSEVDEKEDTEAKEDEKVDEKSEEKADEGDKEVDEKADEKADEGEKEVKEELVDITPVEDVPTEAGDEMGGDPADAMIGDIEADADAEDGEEGSGDDEDLEDRVVDLEDALDDLKAEFDSMMDDKDGDDDGDDDAEVDADADDDAGDEDGEDAEDGFPSDLESEEQPAFEGKEAEAKAEATEPKSSTELMREYVTKVSSGHGAESKGAGETAGTNTKSTVASKNDMGGEAKNIATGGEGGGSNTGLTGNDAKEDSAGNVNVPGGKASKSLKSDSKGHGTEKKGKGEEGGTNTDSVIGS